MHCVVNHSFFSVMWFIHMCDMTHLYVWYDSFIIVDLLLCPVTRCVVDHSFTSATWLSHMWDMTHSYVRHDSFICETWLIHYCRLTAVHCDVLCRQSLKCECDMVHSHVWQSVTWLIHMWDVTPSYVWCDSLICETWLMHMWDVTHSYVRRDSFIYITMQWLRLVGSLKW